MLDPALSRFAAALAGWPAGTRLGNDSVWLKPPAAGGEVAYHRDSWYVPYPMLTAWVTLTDVDEHNGTLEYVPGCVRRRQGCCWRCAFEYVDAHLHVHRPSRAPPVHTARSSHRWPPAPPFNRDEFHVGAGQYRASAERLAAAAGARPAFVKVVAPAGSVVFHHGDLLHGACAL